MTSPALGFSVFPIRKSALFFPGTGEHSRGMNFPRNGYGWARVLKREAPPHDSGRPLSPAAVPSAFRWKSPLKSGIQPAPAGDGISLPTGIYTWQSTLLSLPHGWPRPPAGNPFPRPGGSCGPSAAIISGPAVFSMQTGAGIERIYSSDFHPAGPPVSPGKYCRLNCYLHSSDISTEMQS